MADETTQRPAEAGRCPRCESPEPGKHPAMQADGGEVQMCPHPFHLGHGHVGGPTGRHRIHDLLEESYVAILRRQRKAVNKAKCPGHVWARQLPGFWTCDNCPERRETL